MKRTSKELINSKGLVDSKGFIDYSVGIDYSRKSRGRFVVTAEYVDGFEVLARFDNLPAAREALRKLEKADD